METTELIYWSLFAALTIGEILVVFVFKLPKENKVRDWVEPAFEAIIIATIIRTLLIQAFRIPTSSMEDNLLIGDHLLANKYIYGTTVPWSDDKLMKFSTPKRGEVVIFRYPEDPRLMFIKRCMGMPGDTIEMKDKVLYINGKMISEPYVYHKDMRVFPANYTVRDNFGPVTVPPGSYFMMGDNRDFSSDSRFWGFLPYKYLRGKAWVVYWPPNRWKVIKHFSIKADEADIKGNTTGVVAATTAN
ncbi:MAG: signal peptidase I [Spirochaetia bacterium]|nr:signal peptidase I [Spirochaetia bacterium]